MVNHPGKARDGVDKDGVITTDYETLDNLLATYLLLRYQCLRTHWPSSENQGTGGR